MHARAQFSLAISTYQQSLPLAPSPAQRTAALTSLADAHSNLKQYHAAAAFYQQAVDECAAAVIAPPTDLLIGKLFNQLQIGQWRGYERTVTTILTDCRRVTQETGQPSPLSPYRGLFLPLAPEMALSTAESWARGFLLAERQPPYIPVVKPSRTSQPLRVSYLSRRFEDYPGTQMMLRLFATHNRSRVTVGAFAHGADDGSTYRSFIRDRADLFVDVSEDSDAVAAGRIRGAQVDVLVSYDGMHDFNSVKVLMKRPATIQMTWLGFAATTGFRPTQGIDYAIADAVIAAPDCVGGHFSEKLVFMPDCYQPQDELQGVSQVSATYLPVYVMLMMTMLMTMLMPMLMLMLLAVGNLHFVSHTYIRMV
jgi:protein O-GlcNAc transferase